MADKNIEAIYPLTPVQEGILYHTLASSRVGEYFNQYTCAFETAIDPDRYKWAWQKVVGRHGVLRSLFAWEKQDKPLQIVRKRVTLPWEFEDWCGMDADAFEHRWEVLLQRQREQGFDLAVAPLMRFFLVRLDDGRYRFLWCFHHALIDGWSLRLILDEVVEYYGGLDSERLLSTNGHSTFEDFVTTVHAPTNSARSYWTDLLAGFKRSTSPVNIVAEPPNQSSVESAVQTHRLNPQVVGQIDAYARRQRLTLNTMVLGAWAILLGRYAESDDVVFGTTVSGRSIDVPGVEAIVGMFVNTLPMRIQVPIARPPNEWLRGIQNQQIQLREYEHSSLVEVQRCSDLQPGSALFDSIVVFQNVPPPQTSPAQKRLGICDEHYLEYSHYPFALLVFPGEALKIVAVYDPSRFDHSAVAAIIEQLEEVLRALASNEHQSVGEIPIFSDAQRYRLHETWNGPSLELPRNRLVFDIIAEHASTDPNAIAIEDDQESVTYGELMRRISAATSKLADWKIGKDVCVPVFAERSVDAIVAMLAVLRVGGAYVPVDATHPQERSRYIFSDLIEQLHAACDGVPRRLLVLTQSHLLEKLPLGDFDTICIDKLAIDCDSATNQQAPLNPSLTEPDDLAYVIYTSGSSGRPKGVMVTHGNMVNSTLARPDYYPEELSGFLVLSSIATDSSIAGIFWALCTGAKLILPPTRIEQDIPRLSALVKKHQASHILCLPSLYLTILEHIRPAHLESLRCVIVVGEQCTNDVVARHFAIHDKVALYNEYGPTEASVWATVLRLRSVYAKRPITIGRPIANTSIYIFDQAMRPAPFGVAGEIYIGGAGIARGYLNDEQKTSERFVINPIEGCRDTRLYKTGDRGRFHPSGEVEFLGRIDDQIKIRGYRIEPQEIEVVLRLHPAIADAAVVVEHVGESMPISSQTSTDSAVLAEQIAFLNPVEADALLTEVEVLSASDVEREIDAETVRTQDPDLGRFEGVSR